MDQIVLFLFLASIVFVALILERKAQWARSFGAALICIFLGIVFSNIALIPHQSPVYDSIFSYLVPVAIFFLLLHVDIRELKKASPKMLLAFLIGALGVLIGVFCATFLMKSLMGEEFWKIAGMFTGTYIGGGVNYVGVASALEVSPNVFAGGAAADNITTAVWMIVCILFPKYFYRSVHMNQAMAKKFNERQEMLEMSLESFAALIGLGLFSLFLSTLLHGWFPVIPSILWMTTFSIVLAQTKTVKKYRGSEILGNYTILLFFVTLGAICDVGQMLDVGVYLFYFTMIIVIIHGVFIFSVSKLVKIPIEVALLSSQACIGGAPSSVSLAKVLGLKKYLASSALIGIVGYAVGNYMGVFVAYLVKALF